MAVPLVGAVLGAVVGVVVGVVVGAVVVEQSQVPMKEQLPEQLVSEQGVPNGLTISTHTLGINAGRTPGTLFLERIGSQTKKEQSFPGKKKIEIEKMKIGICLDGG